jgi:hypothetical protein
MNFIYAILLMPFILLLVFVVQEPSLFSPFLGKKAEKFGLVKLLLFD